MYICSTPLLCIMNIISIISINGRFAPEAMHQREVRPRGHQLEVRPAGYPCLIVLQLFDTFDVRSV